MDAKTYFIQLSLYIRWLLFAFIVLLSVSLNESTEIITRSGTIGKIELNFNTSGHVPIVTWTLPHSTTFQHDLQVDNVVKTTEDYRSTVAEDGVFAALEIYNVNFLDAGTYTCRMDFSDTGRSSERAIEVLVIAFPSVSMRNDATENETISATCCINVSLAVEDTITWTINQSRSLQILQEVKTYFSAGVMKQLSSEIIFEVNRRYHRQLLRCSLRKPMNVYSEVAMNVQYPASIRYAEDGLHHISVYQFANVCCISEGNPRPSVELLWLSTEGYWNILTNVTEYVYHIEPFTYWTFMIHVAVRQLLQVRCVAINKIPPAATTQVLNVVAKLTSIGNVSTVYLPRQLLAAVISVVLALIFLVALLIRILKNRHDRSCVFPSNRKRFQKEESNGDNDKNERKHSVHYDNYPADIQLHATTNSIYEIPSCEEDGDRGYEPCVIVDCVADYTSGKEYDV
ncbi:uncharacterized protein [Apostichopus japonicus]|uniref:uncharacterized protein isoform X3 n=1 Tax=Stichopus japonicus TaxID=307972 RepID=UPI003AB43BFB